MARWWTRLRLWLARVLRGLAERVVPSHGTVSSAALGPLLAEAWDGIGPKHEVWLAHEDRTYTFKSGAAATAWFQHMVDHRETGVVEFRTDGVTRSRYDGGAA